MKVEVHEKRLLEIFEIIDLYIYNKIYTSQIPTTTTIELSKNWYSI